MGGRGAGGSELAGAARGSRRRAPRTAVSMRTTEEALRIRTQDLAPAADGRGDPFGRLRVVLNGKLLPQKKNFVSFFRLNTSGETRCAMGKRCRWMTPRRIDSPSHPKSGRGVHPGKERARASSNRPVRGHTEEFLAVSLVSLRGVGRRVWMLPSGCKYGVVRGNNPTFPPAIRRRKSALYCSQPARGGVRWDPLTDRLLSPGTRSELNE